MALVHTSFRLLDGAGDVTAEASRHILARAAQAVVARGRFRIVLAGGTTPLAVYGFSRQLPAAWPAWEVYFGDERCLPPDHGERNSLVATQALLGRVPIPRENMSFR